jgi:hypothetical protein
MSVLSASTFLGFLSSTLTLPKKGDALPSEHLHRDANRSFHLDYVLPDYINIALE